MQPMLRTIARVSQQRLGESYILESGGAIFKLYHSPLLFTSLTWLFILKEENQNHRRQGREKVSVALLEYPR